MLPALSAFKQAAVEKFATSLNLPGLPLHINTILLSASFYFSIYTFIGPWLLHNKAPFDYASLPRTRRILWNDWTVSISQSFINTGLAIYLMFFQRADPQSPQERMLGYDSQVATVAALVCGYFCFHFYQTTKDIDIDGYLMSLHAIASIIGAALGFRPFAIFYAPWFLIWELPNIFLNFQRWFDGNGMKSSRLRSLNRKALLSTYFAARTVLGTYGIYIMAVDTFVVIRDPHPKVRKAFLLPSQQQNITFSSSSSLSATYEIPPMNSFLAIIQLVSVTIIQVQGIYWLVVIFVRKGDYNSGRTKFDSDKKNGKAA